MIVHYDIEVYIDEGDWPQGKYLVHGYDDVLWTDDIEAAVKYMKESLERLTDIESFRKAIISALSGNL